MQILMRTRKYFCALTPTSQSASSKKMTPLLFRLSVFLVAASSASFASEAMVEIPGCPKKPSFELGDYWSRADYAPQVIRTLSENSARKAEYTSAWIAGKDDVNAAWVAIGTLGALKSAQGGINKDKFEEIRTLFLSQVNDMPPDITNEIATRIEKLRSGASTPFETPQYLLFKSLEGDESFSILGFVSSPQMSAVTAQKHFLWNGCMIVAQFSFPAGPLELKEIEAAISDLIVLPAK